MNTFNYGHVEFEYLWDLQVKMFNKKLVALFTALQDFPCPTLWSCSAEDVGVYVDFLGWGSVVLREEPAIKSWMWRKCGESGWVGMFSMRKVSREPGRKGCERGWILEEMLRARGVRAFWLRWSVFFPGTEDMPSSTDLFIGSHIYRIFTLRRVFGLLNGTFWNLLLLNSKLELAFIL